LTHKEPALLHHGLMSSQGTSAPAQALLHPMPRGLACPRSGCLLSAPVRKRSADLAPRPGPPRLTKDVPHGQIGHRVWPLVGRRRRRVLTPPSVWRVAALIRRLRKCPAKQIAAFDLRRRPCTLGYRRPSRQTRRLMLDVLPGQIRHLKWPLVGRRRRRVLTPPSAWRVAALIWRLRGRPSKRTTAFDLRRRPRKLGYLCPIRQTTARISAAHHSPQPVQSIPRGNGRRGKEASQPRQARPPIL